MKPSMTPFSDLRKRPFYSGTQVIRADRWFQRFQPNTERVTYFKYRIYAAVVTVNYYFKNYRDSNFFTVASRRPNIWLRATRIHRKYISLWCCRNAPIAPCHIYGRPVRKNSDPARPAIFYVRSDERHILKVFIFSLSLTIDSGSNHQFCRARITKQGRCDEWTIRSVCA